MSLNCFLAALPMTWRTSAGSPLVSSPMSNKPVQCNIIQRSSSWKMDGDHGISKRNMMGIFLCRMPFLILTSHTSYIPTIPMKSQKYPNYIAGSDFSWHEVSRLWGRPEKLATGLHWLGLGGENTRRWQPTKTGQETKQCIIINPNGCDAAK